VDNPGRYCWVSLYNSQVCAWVVLVPLFFSRCRDPWLMGYKRKFTTCLGVRSYNMAKPHWQHL
jgi:hypothetical protein